MPFSDWTVLFDKNLELLLPVRKVIREPGVSLEIGNSYRSWRADYCFSLGGQEWVVEAKLANSDRVIDGTKILAYRKIHNIQTQKSSRALIIARQENMNSADLLLCGLLHISVLAVSFNLATPGTIKFKAKLDGSVRYEKEISVQALEAPSQGRQGVFLA